MSRSMDHRRIARKYGRELDALSGDDGSNAKLYGGLVSSLASGAAEIAANKQAADAKAKQDAINKANAEAAQSKRLEAQHAAINAQGEKDPYGPLHIKAQQLDVEAKALEAKAGSLSLATIDASKSSGRGGKSGSFSDSPYFWPAVGVGVVAVGFVGYKLMSRGGRGGYMAARRGR